MQQAGQRHVVALAQRAIGIHQHFGADKQGDAFPARFRAHGLRQHHMDNVFRQVVVTAGDIHLLPEQAVAAIPRRFRPGGNILQ